MHYVLVFSYIQGLVSIAEPHEVPTGGLPRDLSPLPFLPTPTPGADGPTLSHTQQQMHIQQVAAERLRSAVGGGFAGAGGGGSGGASGKRDRKQ